LITIRIAVPIPIRVVVAGGSLDEQQRQQTQAEDHGRAGAVAMEAEMAAVAEMVAVVARKAAREGGGAARDQDRGGRANADHVKSAFHGAPSAFSPRAGQAARPVRMPAQYNTGRAARRIRSRQAIRRAAMSIAN